MEKPVLSDHLLRSSDEIAPVLDALTTRRANITAHMEGEGVQFCSQFILADPNRQFILITAAADASANAALLARPRVTLVSGLGAWHIEFATSEPSELVHEGAPAIRLRYPEILTAQRRRRHRRIDAPASASLLCLADAGGITPFEAQLIDISPGGIGVLLHASDITIEPGTVLLGCRIEIPDGNPVTVDLEARYSEVVTLSEGARARRSGFRFISAPEELIRLVDRLGEETHGDGADSAILDMLES